MLCVVCLFVWFFFLFLVDVLRMACVEEECISVAFESIWRQNKMYGRQREGRLHILIRTVRFTLMLA